MGAHGLGGHPGPDRSFTQRVVVIRQRAAGDTFQPCASFIGQGVAKRQPGASVCQPESAFDRPKQCQLTQPVGAGQRIEPADQRDVHTCVDCVYGHQGVPRQPGDTERS